MSCLLHMFLSNNGGQKGVDVQYGTINVALALQ